jgi:hypothetical protein
LISSSIIKIKGKKMSMAAAEDSLWMILYAGA